MLILHIIIALSGLLWTGYIFIKPSQKGLRVSYSLVTLTFASGTYLVLTKPTHLMQVCGEGLVYLAVVFIGIMATRHKLASSTIKA